MKNLNELKKLFAAKGLEIGEVNVNNINKRGVHTEYYVGKYTAGEHYTLRGLNELYEVYYA